MLILFFYSLNYFFIIIHFAPIEEEYYNYKNLEQYIKNHYEENITEQKYSILNNLIFLNIFLYYYQGTFNIGEIVGIILIIIDCYTSCKNLKYYYKLKKELF